MTTYTATHNGITYKRESKRTYTHVVQAYWTAETVAHFRDAADKHPEFATGNRKSADKAEAALLAGSPMLEGIASWAGSEKLAKAVAKAHWNNCRLSAHIIAVAD